MNTTCIKKYTIAGIIFGIVFPLFSMIFELQYNHLDYSLNNIIVIHSNNPLLFIIDTAPIFLGSFAWIAGKNQFKSIKSKHKYKKLATIDVLTNLLNRRAGEFHLTKLLENCKKEDKIAILYIDINNFKLINDTLGHQAGDDLLAAIGNKLNQITQEVGMASRIGGDESIIAYPYQTKASINLTLKSIHQFLVLPLIIDNRLVKISASIGVSIYPDHGATLDDLMQCSDAAMYEAKNKNLSYLFYEESLGNFYNQQLLNQSEILSSFQKDSFNIVYRSLQKYNSSELSTIETLIQWNNSSKDTFYPYDFIPLSSNTSPIEKIALWSVEKVCKDIIQWKRATNDIPQIIFNLSEFQINDHVLHKKVVDLIKSFNISLEYFTIKVIHSINHLKTDDKRLQDIINSSPTNFFEFNSNTHITQSKVSLIHLSTTSDRKTSDYDEEITIENMSTKIGLKISFLNDSTVGNVLSFSKPIAHPIILSRIKNKKTQSQ